MPADDKGRVRIPKAVCGEAGLEVGDRVVLEVRDGEVAVCKPRGVLEFEPPQTDREMLPWPDARRAARDERSAGRDRHDQR